MNFLEQVPPSYHRIVNILLCKFSRLRKVRIIFIHVQEAFEVVDLELMVRSLLCTHHLEAFRCFVNPVLQQEIVGKGKLEATVVIFFNKGI